MKLAIFDLDGVLVKTDHIHTNMLRFAVESILHSDASQLPMFDAQDGIRTVDKLKALQAMYDLPDDTIRGIDRLKQMLTCVELISLPKNQLIVDILTHLKLKGYMIALASNSRRLYVDAAITALSIKHLIDFSIAGDEIQHAKPHPECFERAMAHFSATSQQTTIWEDSNAGLTAARATGATVIQVDPQVLLTWDLMTGII